MTSIVSSIASAISSTTSATSTHPPASASASTADSPLSTLTDSAKDATLTATSMSPLSNLFHSSFTLFTSILSILAQLIQFSTITIPTIFFKILSYSFTFHLTFPSLFLLFFILILTLLFWLRYKHLNRYERLRELPLEKASIFKDLDPDSKLLTKGSGNQEGEEEEEGREGFHSYLDEFLKAIKIFGYLEKPVFHELARHLQTRRLIAGDSLSLDSDFSFYIVIDGNVQVFAPLPENQRSESEKNKGFDSTNQGQGTYPESNDHNDGDEYNGFQLINEVGSGGTLSSLFTILSLFTEDVKLSKDSHHDENNQTFNSNPNLASSSHHTSNPSNPSISSPFLNPSQTSTQTSTSTDSNPHPNSHISSFPLNEEALRKVPNAIGSKSSVLERLNSESMPASSENELGESESTTEGSTTVLDDKEHSFNRLGGSNTLEDRFNQDLASSSSASNQETRISQELNQSSIDDEFKMPEARASAPFPHFKSNLSNPASRESLNPSIRGRGGVTGGVESGQITPPRNLSRLPPGINNNSNNFSSHASLHSQSGLHQGYQRSTPAQSNFPTTPSSQFSQFSTSSQQMPHVSKPSDSLHPSVQATVARATQDTTLAVIPAEAFKRLTKKFPNAAAHIVQVILHRLSRVTLHTAHEYLGLTKEVIKTEENLNSNNRFLLQKEFYQGGGMERLRLRFDNLDFGHGVEGSDDEALEPISISPSTLIRENQNTKGGAAGAGEEEEDYFRNGRDGYLDSENPQDVLSKSRTRKGEGGTLRKESTITDFDSLIKKTSAQSSFSPNEKSIGSRKNLPSREGTINFGDLNLKTPRARTSVGPGDLLSMTGNQENGPNPSSSSSFNGQNSHHSSLVFSNSNNVTLKTPRPRSRVSNPFSFKDSDEIDLEERSRLNPKGHHDLSNGAKWKSGERRGKMEEFQDEDSLSNGRIKSWTSLGIENFDLRDSVMNCIARSIGLLAAPNSNNSTQNQSFHGHGGNNGGSIPASSPFINPSDRSHSVNRGIFNSAFSSLSMLDAAGNPGMEDDASSSVNGGVANTNNTNSSFNGQSNLLEKFENEIEIKFYKKGEILINEASVGDGLFYVIDGFLEVGLPLKEDVLKQKNKKNDRSSSSSSSTKMRKGGKMNRNPYQEDDEQQEDNDGLNHRFKDGRSGFNNFQQETNGRISKSKSTNSRKSSFGGGRDSPVHVLPSQRFGNALDGTRPSSSSSSNRNPNATVNPATATSSTNFNYQKNHSNSNVNANFKDASNGNGPNPRFKKSKGVSNDPPPHPDEEKSHHRKNDNSTGLSGTGLDGNASTPIYTVGRGGITGYLSSLLGKPSYVQVKAKTDCYVGVLPAHSLERMMEKRPIVLLTLCKRLLSLLSPLILHIDSALDWQQVNAGQVIYREGDPSDSFYIVITGRLRAITEKKNSNGGVEVLAEYGMGDSVGELDVITNEPRGKTLHAIRDSELARMPMTLFNAISVRHPAITIQISRIIARRVREEMKNLSRAGGISSSAPIPGLPDLGRNNLNLKTVAILPVTRDVPVSDFANRLQTALEDTIGGPTAFLNQSSVMSVLGKHAFNRMGKLKLAGWLAEQEQKYRLVLYVVDTAVSSSWSQTSIRQADSILLVGFGDDPAMGEYERLLLSIKTTARKELVLLHPERSVPPGSTREWLKSRPWIHAHHHVEMPGLLSRTSSHSSNIPPSLVDPKAVKALRNLKQKLETSFRRYKGKHTTVVPGRPSHFSDFARLARRLRGKSIGLVLGGGGARGCAHIGVLRALEERGIPIDMVGGTSIGSLIGGLYAKEAEVVSTLGRAKKFSGRMASLWRFASDLTYPVVSYTTGHEFNRGIFKAFSDTHIEDMWLPFFANSVNITWSRMEVHTTGYAWRYIRASMTLAGLIPPLVDDGCMLVDGGYVDNLPVSVMLAMGARDVFAVDVGSIDDTSPRSYGDTLSGWWVLINKWNPWSDARNIPSIPDIQGRLTYVSSVKTLEEAKKTPGCFYMRMPVEGYGTLEFAKFTEIAQIGYEASQRMLSEWSDQGRLPTGMDESDLDSEMAKRRRKSGISARRNSV